MRVELPPGHKHDWTLKNVQGASKDGASWLVPAQFCAEKVVKGVINDVMLDDRKALAEAIDYLDGFVFSGDLDLTPGEAETLGLAAGGVVFSDPSFVRTADPGLGPEPLYEYPFKVRSFDVVRSEETGDERYSAKLSVLCGNAGWTALRTRFCSPMDARTLPLDGRHVKGKWVRRRG